VAADRATANTLTVEVLGWDRATRRIYLVERGGDAHALLVMTTTGEHAGVVRPVAGDEERIAALRATLVPLQRDDRRGWDVNTRVVQRRGLRVAGMTTPVRKFALGIALTRRQAGHAIAHGRATVTAYLRPRAALDQVWTVPGEALAVAIVHYCGVPDGIGFDKQTAVLARPPLH